MRSIRSRRSSSSAAPKNACRSDIASSGNSSSTIALMTRRPGRQWAHHCILRVPEGRLRLDGHRRVVDVPALPPRRLIEIAGPAKQRDVRQPGVRSPGAVFGGGSGTDSVTRYAATSSHSFSNRAMAECTWSPYDCCVHSVTNPTTGGSSVVRVISESRTGSSRTLTASPGAPVSRSSAATSSRNRLAPRFVRVGAPQGDDHFFHGPNLQPWLSKWLGLEPFADSREPLLEFGLVDDAASHQRMRQ